MRKKTLGLFGAGFVLAASTVIAADEPMGPPKVLFVSREEVKPGKGAAHEKLEAQWPRLFAQAGWKTPYLAMDGMTGPPEVWFVSAYDSFAALEKDNKDFEKNAALKAESEKLAEKDSEFLSSGRGFVAVFRPDLSRHANVDVATMRYFRIATFRVRPGHDKDFADAAKIIADAYDKASIELHWATYQVVGGTGVPAYMVWTPMKSLDELDALLVNSKAIAGAEGEDGQKALAKLSSDGVATVESQIYAFNPRMSYPPKDFAARGGDFWTPKAAAKTDKTEPKKGAKKEEAKPAEKK